MTLSSSQAAESLEEIERTGRRSAQAFGYATASPYLVLWGLIWMVAYAGTDLLPPRLAGWAWPLLTVIGIALCTVIGRRRSRAGGKSASEGRALGLRYLASFFALGGFIAATFAIMPPASPMVTGAFVPLIVALAYVVTGIWKGLRFLVAGLAIAALTLGGYFYLHQHFLLWMAGVGGGALVLAGLWLKKA